jgi:hypothetical protein
MLDYEGIRDVAKRINGGSRSIDLVYIKSENRIATWMGDAPEPEYVWMGSARTYTMPGDRWEFDMKCLYMIFKTHLSLEVAWIDLIKNMKDKLPEFTYWENL